MTHAAPYLHIDQRNPAQHQGALESLCHRLRHLPEINAKRAIQQAACFSLPSENVQALSLEERYRLPGDDCAAFKNDKGYQLLAMEGMLPDFVASDPRAAGWSSVMANVSDIAAMGGRAEAVVNSYWHHNSEESMTLLKHIKRACDVFGLAFAGGHSSVHCNYTPNLAVAITGHANHLLSCHHLKPGQRLFMLTDLTGSWHGDLPYWGCVVGKTPEQIREQWSIPAQLAEQGLAVGAKDISNGGILGTLIMMLELTGCGATIDLNAIKGPSNDVFRWLRAFQSYGFLLTVKADKTSQLLQFFKDSHLSCHPIGRITDSGKIHLESLGASAQFWDLHNEPLTNMGGLDASR